MNEDRKKRVLHFWPLIRESFVALNAKYWPSLEKAAKDRGLKEPAWQYLIYLLVFEPDPASAAALCRRGAYMSPRLYEERLQSLAKQGYVSADSEHGEYRATDPGLDVARSLITAAREAMAVLDPTPMTEPDLERLASLLALVVKAALAESEPPGKWCVTHSRNLDPGHASHPVARIDQYFSDLAAYRDDCHLASWRPHGLEGHAWEILTFIWRGQANSFDELRAKLGHRGFTNEETNAALRELLNRGWIEGDEKQYEVTAEGAEVRQTAQDTTDRYFDRPFNCLSKTQSGGLVTLLKKLSESLSQR